MFKIFKSKIKVYIKSLVTEVVYQNPGLTFLESNVIELNNYSELNKIFSFKDGPILERADIYDFDYILDVNERRIRDAESLGTMIRNSRSKIILEIGTSNGMGTVLIAANAPEAQIFTINIPPEEILNGEGGKLTTIAIEKEEIGIEYKKRSLKNINQIYANTATWQPDIGEIDIAYIDGCHDTEFVYNDTKKILPFMKKGGFILWHDFNLDLVKKYTWINSVCLGVEKLYKEGLLNGRIYHIKDSWVGIYKV